MVRVSPTFVLAQEFNRTPTAFVSGQVTAPAIGAVIADTGQLAAADYVVAFVLSIADTVAVGKRIDVQHRDAANAATLKILGSTPAPTGLWAETRRYSIALNERVRAVNGVAGAASSVYTATIGVWRVP